jgi:hypothetical protein
MGEADAAAEREEDKQLMKEAFKEAYHEWLDDQFARFGRWSFYSLAAMALVALLYFILVRSGWTPPAP